LELSRRPLSEQIRITCGSVESCGAGLVKPESNDHLKWPTTIGCNSTDATLNYLFFAHIQTKETEASKLFQRLGAHLLDHGLPDLVRHPGRPALGLVHLHPLAREYVQLLRASLAKFDVRIAPVGRLQGPMDFAGYPEKPAARRGMALPWPELRTPVHQDGAPDNSSPGRRSRDPGGLVLGGFTPLSNDGDCATVIIPMPHGA